MSVMDNLANSLPQPGIHMYNKLCRLHYRLGINMAHSTAAQADVCSSLRAGTAYCEK